MYKPNFIYHLGGSLGDRIAVIDISQSMRNAASKSSRLEVAVAVTEAFIKRLGCDEPQSKISVIVFGKTALITIRSVYIGFSEPHSRIISSYSIKQRNRKAGFSTFCTRDC